MIKLNQRKIILGIDASNLRGGGGSFHLVELLRAAQPHEHDFDQVIVWGGERILNSIADRGWLVKIHKPILDKHLLKRLYWQRFELDRLARQEGCAILLIPGGSYFGSFRPFVTMCQNMLPFEWSEARRYGISWLLLKFLLLRKSQLKTFQKADGLIFPTEYAKKKIAPLLNETTKKIAVIPHGLEERFSKEPKQQRPISTYTVESPFHLLYVSKVEPYKHQWNVVEAVYMLRQRGLPLVLDLVGPIKHSGKRFFKALSRWDLKGGWIHYRGELPFNKLHEIYLKTESFVFASSCESFSMIILEAMSAGLPIASSSKGAMPELLGKGAVYFNPESPSEIAKAIEKLILSPELRETLAWKVYYQAKRFSWERCTRETFHFISRIINEFDG
jgi:glycosyltransferase involved in cell wall biosynthesis